MQLSNGFTFVLIVGFVFVPGASCMQKEMKKIVDGFERKLSGAQEKGKKTFGTQAVKVKRNILQKPKSWEKLGGVDFTKSSGGGKYFWD